MNLADFALANGNASEAVRLGRELERQTLTHTVRLHLERRVLIIGNRTIVFA